MRQRRNRIRAINPPEITMDWTKEEMFADPRVVALDEADIIDVRTKKADIIAAVKLIK